MCMRIGRKKVMAYIVATYLFNGTLYSNLMPLHTLLYNHLNIYMNMAYYDCFQNISVLHLIILIADTSKPLTLILHYMFMFGLILLFNSKMQWHLFSLFPFDLSTSNPSCFNVSSNRTWSHFRDNAIYFNNFLLACVYHALCSVFRTQSNSFST